jgi:hypothetical protein
MKFKPIQFESTSDHDILDVFGKTTPLTYGSIRTNQEQCILLIAAAA